MSSLSACKYCGERPCIIKVNGIPCIYCANPNCNRLMQEAINKWNEEQK